MNKAQALNIFSAPLAAALNYRQSAVLTCAIINAKSGSCGEDCKFCAQSAVNNTGVAEYPLISTEKLVSAAENAFNYGAACFGIVTSGNELTDTEFARLCAFGKTFKGVHKLSLSVGRLSTEKLKLLKAAGFTKIHHNLETSRNFFKNICGTHSYDERVNTIRRALENGFKVCSGGLFGIGESLADRVDLAFELQGLGVHSIALNFFISHKGSALEEVALPPAEILKTICMFRAVNPLKHITVCGGRSLLGDKQNLIFAAGASGMMVGDYLTVKGVAVEQDLKMIESAVYGNAKQPRC